jgi:cobalt-zinc-cadmium efflux system protein
VLDHAGELLRDRFGVAHSTLQVEAHAHTHHEDHCG